MYIKCSTSHCKRWVKIKARKYKELTRRYGSINKSCTLCYEFFRTFQNNLFKRMVEDMTKDFWDDYRRRVAKRDEHKYANAAGANIVRVE